MKRLFVSSLVLLLTAGLPWLAWAAKLPTMTVLNILPLTSSRYLVEVDGRVPVNLEVSAYGGYPALHFTGACFSDSLFDSRHLVKSAAFVRYAEVPVALIKQSDGCWLQFQTHEQATFFVVANHEAFLTQAANQLPLHPLWAPRPLADHSLPVEERLAHAQANFAANHDALARQDLQAVAEAMPQPSEDLYKLLGAEYLSDNDWLHALCLYAEGSARFPQSLGLRYAALLYQMQQPQKSEAELKEVVSQPAVTIETLSEAQFMLGSLYAETRDYAQAIRYLKPAAVAYPDNATVLYNLALSYQGLQLNSQALDAYQQALPHAGEDLASEIQTQIKALRQQALRHAVHRGPAS